MRPPSPERIDAELVRRRGFREFVRQAWPLVESAPFVDSWHIGAMCEFLQAVNARQIRTAVINIPPGCSKSLLVSTLYPAWVWTCAAGERFMCASYDASLSYRDAKRHKDLFTSSWYQRRWPCALTQDQVGDFSNAKGGFRFSTSIAGKATGRHAHQRLIDDPIKPKDTTGGSERSRAALKACEDWFSGTWISRIADAAQIVDLLIMQRLHDADLAAKFFRIPGCETLMLPMRYEPKRACYVRGVKMDPRTEPGELLCPARFDEATVTKLEISYGQFASAQLQQNPVPAGGDVFLLDWIMHWIAPPRAGVKIQSWDLTFKGAATSDYVVGQVWQFTGARYYLLDQERGRWGFADSCAAMKRLTARNPMAITKLIEEKANGAAVIETMSKEIVGIEAVNPEGGKESRANAVQGLWKSGCCWIPPESVLWVPEFQQEVTRFPRAVHDDQVDSMTQALIYLTAHSNPLAAAMEAIKNEKS